MRDSGVSNLFPWLGWNEVKEITIQYGQPSFIANFHLGRKFIKYLAKIMLNKIGLEELVRIYYSLNSLKKIDLKP